MLSLKSELAETLATWKPAPNVFGLSARPIPVGHFEQSPVIKLAEITLIFHQRKMRDEKYV